MTKDEFLAMVSNELESLEKEYQSAKLTKLSVYNPQNPNFNAEFKNANYQLTLIEQKIKRIKEILGFPAYARIQAMSDAEIDAYKQEKNEELELRIAKLSAQEAQESAKYSRLKAQQEALAIQIGMLSGEEKKKALIENQRLHDQLYDLTRNGRFRKGIIPSIKSDIMYLNNTKQRIQNESPQEIKNRVVRDKIGFVDGLKRELDLASRSRVGSLPELLATLSNSEKARKLANLLACYKQLSREQTEGKTPLLLDASLPGRLKSAIVKSTDAYDIKNFSLMRPDVILEIIADFEPTFNQAKSEFVNQCTPQKLLKLGGTRFGVITPEVDMQFLQQHQDKLDVGELEYLQSLVALRKKLSRKIFKTKEVKLELINLKEQIMEEHTRICRKIIGWYESRDMDLLLPNLAWEIESMTGPKKGITDTLDAKFNMKLMFNTEEGLPVILDDTLTKVNEAQQAIQRLKEEVQRIRDAMPVYYQDYENRKAEVMVQIETLGGPDFMQAIRRYGFGEDPEANLRVIAQIAGNLNQAVMINDVQQEAQNQADIKEAELRGMSLEEFLQMKQTMAGQPSGQDVSEGVGMRR